MQCMAESTDGSSNLPAERSSRAHPSRKRGTPELAVSALETLHHVGLASQKLPLGIWCLRQTDLFSIPAPTPPHPAVPAYHSFAWIDLHLHPPFEAKFYPALKVQLNYFWTPLFSQTATSPQVGGICSFYNPFPVLLLTHCLPSTSQG